MMKCGRTIVFLFIAWICYVECADPNITDIGVPININEDVVTETSLDVFNVTDPDGDTVTSCTLTGHNGEFYLVRDTIDNTQFELFLISNAGLDYNVTSLYTLVVECVDDQMETGTATILVNILPNEPPTIVPPLVPVNVGENEVAQRAIYTIDVTDAENDSVSCDIQSISPNSFDFGLWRATTEYEVYLLSTPSLDYDVHQSYTMTIICSDPFGSSTVDLTIDVIPNAPPVFDNIPGPYIVVDASTALLGDVIFTVKASDNDSASLTFSMVSTPASPDLFTIDSVLGEIRTTKDLEYAVDSAYSLAITVFDGDESTTDYLIVNLTNINIAPIINNLPDTVDFRENTNPNTVLFTIDRYDADGDTTTVTYTVNPAEHTSVLNFNNGSVGEENQLRLSSDRFDYETCSKFVVDFYISDGKAETGPYSLIINVIDVNEQCTFDSDMYYISMAEGNSGTGTIHPGYIVTDEDVGDTFTYSIDQSYSTESTYFDVDPTSGDISFALNYDVDVSHPANVTLIVVCTDVDGDTGTATVEVEVTDVNDNVPTFTQVGYLSYIDQTSGPATTIRQMNMYNKDIDSGFNGKVEYTWTPVTAGSSNYFHMTNKGVVLLTVYAKNHMTYGDVHRFVVTATDQGTPPLSSTAILDIMYRYVNYTYYTTTTVAPETEEESFWDSAANIAAVVLGSILGLILLGLLAYLLFKCCKNGGLFRNCCTNCCKKTATPKVNPSTKPQAEKQPFDFWNRKNNEHSLLSPKDEGLYGNSEIGGVRGYENMPTPNI